jgi:hypothetical protein
METLSFPDPDSLPLESFIWTQTLMDAPARSSPEIHYAIHVWENPGGDTPAALITSPKQEKMLGWMHMTHKLTNPFKVIARHEVLLGKNILQLGIIFVCKFQIVRGLHDDAFFVSLANTSSTSARHPREELAL